jgi:hypothetical protein
MGLDDTKVWVIGPKNFGLNNGVFYNDRSSDRHARRILPKGEYLELNSELSRQWGPRFIDLLSKVQDEDRTVPVFTPSGKFISQDCEHLTRAGARHFALLLSDDLRQILRKPPLPQGTGSPSGAPKAAG